MTSPRFMQPRPPYITIKIPKKEQAEKREKLTKHIYADPGSVYMKRELQFGVIEKIGTLAAEYFPQASIGDYLLVHHFVSGKKTDNGYNFYLIDEDSDFNYYIVNATELPGERNLCYGVYSNGIIVPNRDNIFLELREESSSAEVSESGLLVHKMKKTRHEWMEEMKNNMERCKQLARNIPQDYTEEKRWMADPKKRELMEYSLYEIKKLEAENIKISKDLNKRRYELFKAAHINPEWNDSIKQSFGDKINTGDMVYMLNLACHTTIDIFGKELIIAETKYYGGSLNYMKKAVDAYSTSCHNITREKKIID